MDRQQGDNWDHVAFDPEHRLVVSVVPGKRTEDKTHQLVQDFKERTGGRIMNLMTSDEYPVYKTALFEAYAVEQPQPRTGRPGRPKKPKKVLPKGLTYATVHKERENGRVKKVTTRVVFGTKRAVLAALALSLVSTVVNTVFVERHNGSDRRLNQRAHYRMAEKCSSLAFSVGVASAVVSGAVGVLILLAVRYDPPVWLRVTIGCLSILGAVVAAA